MLRTQYEGPLTARRTDVEAVAALATSVFRSNGGDMGAEYPLLFHPRRGRQLHIMTRNGAPVSLVGMTVNDVVMYGCRTKVACIGSVCTAQEHRGKGLAGKLVDAAAVAARRARATVMLISGGRSLYTRRGASDCGVYSRCEFDAKRAARRAKGLTVQRVGHNAWRGAHALWQAEHVRFERSLADYRLAAAQGWPVLRGGGTYVVRKAKRAVAVVTVRPKDASTLRTIEFAGSRTAALPGLGRIGAAQGFETVTVMCYPADVTLVEETKRLGGDVAKRRFGGMVKLLDPRGLWRDFRRLIARSVGTTVAKSLRVAYDADDLCIHTLRFTLGKESVELRGAQNLTAALFGHPTRRPLGQWSKGLGSLLDHALPLPLPLYGLNFV